MSEEIDLVEVTLKEIQATEGPGAQIMILAEVVGNREFPIFIGPHEMDALDRAIHLAQSPRPMTHDLILAAIKAMKGELVRVLVDDLREDTFFGKLVIRLADGEEVLVDSRPSDAMVVAARMRVPIYVADHILDRVDRSEAEEDEFE